MKKRISIGVIVLLVLGGIGFGWWHFGNSSDLVQSSVEAVKSDESPIQISVDGKTVSYNGVIGETALSTLKKLTSVETKAYDFGEQVMAINGLAAGSSEFWSFYVNGQQAAVGAGSYDSVAGDRIEWKLETF